MTDRILCQVYASPKRAETYLYVDRREDLARVPEALLAQFGTPSAVMVVVLSAERKLARADAASVMAGIREKGFYLQMPPQREAYMLDLYRTPTEGRY
ncbi:YcgL domain-containing protein [Carnimonas bestiolae]|uniref:YcgL domain-containing protein n=1 Tax=Carnimonas bestiolae TaxID=3402172 RepID=UPI003EDBF4E7